MDFLQRINNALWRHAFAKEQRRVDAMASATLAPLRACTTIPRIRLARAPRPPGRRGERRHPRRGVHSAPLGQLELCAAKHCADCPEKLRTASARPQMRTIILARPWTPAATDNSKHRGHRQTNFAGRTPGRPAAARLIIMGRRAATAAGNNYG
eukprot:CAMPEP_0206036384 /NCGR_PEP_ID=MMETSP1466-20131121/2726_1 /ASSEMBLY_ACC=CAM_ASM_001126 /TAXON_ID=44452 /ORGANISM="Pavlova gyrans, Strain CCMP608" /LENGTH=153 /DNA_ID=CAMNT_0053410849 /DNA_START=275 /DNA_END=736 /DNA_ORIENTATION=-